MEEKQKLLSELEYEVIGEFIKIRKESGFTQKQLAESAGVIREKIAKLETHLNSPQLNSLIQLLEPMGYTVRIVPLKK